MSFITDIGLLVIAETPWVLVYRGKLTTPGRTRQQAGGPQKSTAAGTGAALPAAVESPRQPAPPLMATGQAAPRRKRRPGEPYRNAALAAHVATRPRGPNGSFLPVDSQPNGAEASNG